MYHLHPSSVDILTIGHPSIVYINDHLELDVSKWEFEKKQPHRIAVQTARPPFTLTDCPAKTRTLLLSDILSFKPESGSHKLQTTTVYLREPSFRATLRGAFSLQDIMDDYDIVDKTTLHVFYSGNSQSPFGGVWEDITQKVNLNVNWRKDSMQFQISQFGCYCVVVASEVIESQVVPYLHTITETANENTYRLMVYKKTGDDLNRYVFDLVPITQNVTEALFKTDFQQQLFSVMIPSQEVCLYGIIGDRYELQDEQVLEFHLENATNMQAGTLVDTLRPEEDTASLKVLYHSKHVEATYWFSMPLHFAGHWGKLTNRTPVIYKDFLVESKKRVRSVSVDVNENAIKQQMRKEVKTAQSWSQPMMVPGTDGSTNASYVPFTEFKLGSLGKASWNALMKILDSKTSMPRRNSVL